MVGAQFSVQVDAALFWFQGKEFNLSRKGFLQPAKQSSRPPPGGPPKTCYHGSSVVCRKLFSMMPTASVSSTDLIL